MSVVRKTGVVIIGSGPAGLMLGHLLRADGIECIVLERQSQDYVLSRIRAGVLERTTTDLLDRLGINERLHREGIPDGAFNIATADRMVRVDLIEHTGQQMMIYGQTEITRDLMDAAPGRGLETIYSADDVALHDIDGDAPYVTFRKDGTEHRIDASFIAGCDGYHGPSRRAIPTPAAQEFEREYPFGWLGILADVPPGYHELAYATHDRGFALASMRSWSRSRYYIDVPMTERIEDWPDERLWDELVLRMGPVIGPNITRGPALEKSIAPLRSYVFAPMQYGRLFLAGDAAHIVPPTGAKGLNLAASDVAYLSEALIAWFERADEAKLAGYGSKALARVWKAERFSWYLTKLLHHFPEDGAFERQMRLAELDYIDSSPAMQAAIAENYVGLPL